MKKILILVLLLPVLCFSRDGQHIFPIIPQPLFLKADTGFFTLYHETVLADGQNNCANEAKIFNEYLRTYYGFTLQTAQKFGFKNSIILKLDSGKNRVPESYEMEINAHTISISGDRSGIFYALQSLRQLIPANAQGEIKIPCCQIKDSPRYAWRGMHLDVCRHFFSKNEVKKYLDYLAFYKFNVFHWHLTEDQGWRIEIKKYPKLTEIGSIRKETVIGKPSDTAKYDGKPYGGFYSQEDIKEIVAYAQALHITVVPEIEMPGHSLAALSAYPWLSCKGGTFEAATTWGVFDDVYCAGNDSTFSFLENVLTEVCALFPGKYIHIGGDECPKVRWEKCPKCQKRIREEKLKDTRELQSYFIGRIEKFLNAKGKQIIGWDEILEGGLAPNAAVMSWRGTEGGIAAAKQKHFVVMSPGKPCYFDHYQSKDKAKEPLTIGGYNPLEKVYAYEPSPASLDPEQKKFILGAQANVWTEYMTDFAHVEYMAIPRMCALAEVLWTPANKKNYTNFIVRLKSHSMLLDKMGVNYAKHFLHPN